MRMLATDPVLDALRAAVVDSPGDDGPRHAFAGRLADLGHRAWAHVLRVQLHQPFTRLLVPGEVFGLPTAGGVFRRGFLDQLHVAVREAAAVLARARNSTAWPTACSGPRWRSTGSDSTSVRPGGRPAGD